MPGVAGAAGDAVGDPRSEAAGTDRRRVPRRELARLENAGRAPLPIIERQNAGRVPELVPLRSERMSRDRFAFYRGTAGIMAADLARDPTSGILVASCGDAHVANFGFYASPHRTLVFDLNDFDEAGWAPWEWDVKRLVTSVIIGGRETERDEGVIESAARRAVTAYQRALQIAVGHSPLERYYSHFDLNATRATLDPPSRKVLRSAIKAAQKRTGERAVRKLTNAVGDGTYSFVLNPPVMTPGDATVRSRMEEAFEAYRRSVSVDVAMLLSQYVLDDVARRVVGVGSVGTRCYLALLRDASGGMLILQVKEAGRSVLEEFGGIGQPEALTETVRASGQGRRVVGMQRILQAHSDPFLGHLRTPERDFYVRQFHDMKGGLDVVELDDRPFVTYAEACGVVLARAHAQSPRAAEVVAYIGKGRRTLKSIVSWCQEYAEVSRRDYDAFVAEVRR